MKWAIRGLAGTWVLAATLACTGEAEMVTGDGEDVAGKIEPQEAEKVAEPAEKAAEPATGAEGAICPTVEDLTVALRGTPEGEAISWKTLTDVRCNLIWATARAVPEGDMDAATVLFSRSAKGNFVPVTAGTGGVCEEIPIEADKQGLDCD